MKPRLGLLYWVAAAAIVVAVLLVYIPHAGSPASVGPAALAGQKAPSFTVEQLGGGAGSLETYRGSVVVMNLWATWCPPCRAEMPDLQRLYESNRSRGVIVLGVDQGESAAQAGAFAHSLGIRYPILIDEQQQYGRVYAALGMPTTIVIDRNGYVVHGYDGALSYDQMAAAIAPLTGKRS